MDHIDMLSAWKVWKKYALKSHEKVYIYTDIYIYIYIYIYNTDKNKLFSQLVSAVASAEGYLTSFYDWI